VKPIFFGIIILGALVIYEAWQGFKKNQTTPAPGMQVPSGAPQVIGTQGGNTTALTTTGGIPGCSFSSAPGGYSSEELLNLAAAAGFVGNAANTIACIAQRESNGIPTAGNPNAAFGILQFFPFWESTPLNGSPWSRINPQQSFSMAYQNFKQTGTFGPWLCGVVPTSPQTVLGCEACPEACG
jgi:hypothetical protein